MRPSITNGVVLELNYPWPDPGQPPPPPAPAACLGLPGLHCGACPPPTMPLKCPAGQKVRHKQLCIPFSLLFWICITESSWEKIIPAALLTLCSEKLDKTSDKLLTNF